MRSPPSSAGWSWLVAMPPSIARRRSLLEYLLAWVEREPACRWLELSCSLARHAGDEWSDVDAGLGVTDDAWPEILDTVAEVATRFSPAADVLRQPLAGRDERGSLHLFLQYADGVQLSLVVMPAPSRPGLPPQAVALYDADGRLGHPWTPAADVADPARLREWAFLGWIALADLVKYVRRGSLWEARASLEEARTQIWRLHAAARGLTYPVFGLTALLDGPDPRLPDRVEETVSGLAADTLVSAAGLAADLLEEASRVVTFERPEGMARYVRGCLEALVS